MAEDAPPFDPRKQTAGLEHRELEERIGSAIDGFLKMAVRHGEAGPPAAPATTRVGWLKAAALA